MVTNMRTELWFLLIVGGLVYNAYHDNKYTKLLLAYKKYYQMAAIAFVAICLYTSLKRSPQQGKQMLYYANQMVQHLPVDRNSMDTLSRVFDLTTHTPDPFMKSCNNNHPMGKPMKRVVSETKKKYVASIQDWKCGQCRRKLSHTFEVDHQIRLDQGGTNEVSNLIALCRECHGEKTAMENM